MVHTARVLFLAILSALAFAACEQGGEAAEGGDGDSDGDSDGDTDTDACFETEFTVKNEPAALMILLDNSGSMDSGIGETKWEKAKTALVGLLESYAGTSKIAFGFDVFPDFECSGFCCDVSHAVVSDCALDNESALVTL